MRFRQVEAPSEEPLTLAGAKSHLRLDTVDDDDYLTDLLIPAARQLLEELCWRGFIIQKWELVLGGFHGKNALELRPHVLGHPVPLGQNVSPLRGQFWLNEPIELPRGNLAKLEDDAPAVESVKYIDPNGVQQTLDPSGYTVDDVSEPGRILPPFGKFWPATRVQWDAVRVTYSVGWAKADVPAPLKQAMLIALAEMYEHRTPDLGDLPPAVRNLAGPYRLNEIG